MGGYGPILLLPSRGFFRPVLIISTLEFEKKKKGFYLRQNTVHLPRKNLEKGSPIVGCALEL